MATRSSILTWRTPWTEEPGGLRSIASQRVRQDLATEYNFELAKLNALLRGNLQSDAPPICPRHCFRTSLRAAVFYMALGDSRVKQ